MHIKNFRHRHALALPLFAAALIGMSLKSVSLPLHRSVASVVHANFEAKSANLPVQFEGGTYGLLLEDGKLSRDDELSLDAGTVMLASQGAVRVVIGDTELTGFHGAFQATRNGDTAVIAALTTPVLARLGGSVFVIPAGMAGEQRLRILDGPAKPFLENIVALTLIPQEILTEQLERLQSLTPGTLPSLHHESLQAFQNALHEGDRAAAQLLLQAPEFQGLLTPDVLPVLLADAADMPSVAGELLAYLNDEDLWLTLSFHGNYRAPAFGSSGPLSVSDEARELRWLQFPQSDVLPGAASAMTVSSWSAQVWLALAAMENPEDYLSDLLRVLAPYHDMAEAQGWAERVRRYSDEIAQIAAPYRDLLSDDAKARLSVWEQVEDIPPYTEVPAEPATDVSAPPSAPLSDSEAAAALSAAKALLQNAGALFTVKTTLTAKTADQVSVDGILFAAATGERAYRFDLTISTEQLSGIEEDGQSMPFPMSLEQFAAWVRGDGGR